MSDFKRRGEAAEDCIRRWLGVEEGCERMGDVKPQLSRRQTRTLRMQIVEAIKRWEKTEAGLRSAKKRLGKKG